MVELALHAEPLERQHHARAQVAQRVVRRGREVALLLADRVAEARECRSSSGPRRSRPCSAPRSGRSCTRPRRRRRTRTRGRRKHVSAMPVERRYSSARFATRRGSFAYGSSVTGSAISQSSESVGTSVNGSRIAVDASGIRIMSLSSIPCQPRIEEPSKPRPSSNADSSNDADRQRHVLPRAEQVAELQVDHRRAASRATTRAPRAARRRPRGSACSSFSISAISSSPPLVLDHKKRPHRLPRSR